MRSITLKLALAFLLVGVTGALLVAFLVARSTRSEFSRFVSERNQSVVVETLREYYAVQGSWDGIGTFVGRSKQLQSYGKRLTLVDTRRNIVLANSSFAFGQQLPERMVNGSTPIVVNGQTVGYVLVNGWNWRDSRISDLPMQDAAFLGRVAGATVTSAVIAAVIALLLGVLLANSLTRPLRELTVATEATARGQLGQQVTVRSQDEIGTLAQAFNHMSRDLARASQARKQMTADLAHDLRTPLSVLRGYTEGLKDERINGAPALYRLMHEEVEHLQRLVEELRVLSLADAGELPLNRRAVDPRALLERVGLAHMLHAEEQGLGLRLEAPQTLPSVLVDTDRMAQVLNNLVSNALRHTARGEIVLSAEADTQQVRLGVRDTGSGIAPADLPFIFERLFRADASRQRADHNASGLGLAIAKAIVEAHGGQIAVASTLGVGTIFTITLPQSVSH